MMIIGRIGSFFAPKMLSYDLEMTPSFVPKVVTYLYVMWLIKSYL